MSPKPSPLTSPADESGFPVYCVDSCLSSKRGSYATRIFSGRGVGGAHGNGRQRWDVVALGQAASGAILFARLRCDLM